MLSKTQIYLDHFARFKRKENVEAVERLLSAHKELAKFERAQLGMFPHYIPSMECSKDITAVRECLEADFNRIPMLRYCRGSQDSDSKSHG
jgi:hypothetical protein